MTICRFACWVGFCSSGIKICSFTSWRYSFCSPPTSCDCKWHRDDWIQQAVKKGPFKLWKLTSVFVGMSFWLPSSSVIMVISNWGGMAAVAVVEPILVMTSSAVRRGWFTTIVSFWWPAVFMWLYSNGFRINPRPQTRHSYGFLSLCTNLCAFRLSLLLNALPQTYNKWTDFKKQLFNSCYDRIHKTLSPYKSHFEWVQVSRRI